MPRKAQEMGKGKGTSKGQQATKKKAIEDKTFGMKNKKGKAVQKQIASMQQSKSKQEKMKEIEYEQRKTQKKEKKKEEAETAALFKVAQKVQKCPAGVDPKSILCINFKSGYCAKGNSCIFSHDLSTERKAEKRNIYADVNEDNMDNWDDQTLAEVVQKKQIGKPHNPNAGICNHFIKAIEERKFGWFWECPNGDKCQYRHDVPPGFVLKPKKAEKDETEERAIEDIVEEQRSKLKGGTQINNTTFAEWRKKIKDKKDQDDKSRKDKHSAEVKAGRARKTGREILSEGNFNDSVEEGEGAVDILSLLRVKKDEEEAIDMENLKAVEQMQKTAEELESDIKIREEDEVLLSPSTDDIGKPTLEGVDTSLFTEDIDEEIPEDLDDDEENEQEENNGEKEEENNGENQEKNEEEKGNEKEEE